MSVLLGFVDNIDSFSMKQKVEYINTKFVTLICVAITISSHPIITLHSNTSLLPT